MTHIPFLAAVPLMAPHLVKDLYKMLGVSADALEDDIKKAFRLQVALNHPDRFPDDPRAEDRFKEINQAYRVLMDPQKRKYYDFMRTHPLVAGQDQAPGNSQDTSFFKWPRELGDILGGLAGLGDIWGRITGRNPRSERSRAIPRGEDIRISVNIPFPLAVNGGTHGVEVRKNVPCPSCGGSGSLPDDRFSASPEEMGADAALSQQCGHCQGRGFIQVMRSLKLEIPPGIETGQVIRVRAEGLPGMHGMPQGDLYAEILVEHQDSFQWDGESVQSEIEIDLHTAMLGGRVSVDTLSGPVALKIPPATQPGTCFRLSAKGLSLQDGRLTDHHVIVRVRLPGKLTEEQERLFCAFSDSLKS